MKKNMEDIQQKEAEENTALENMVQQIEANLTTTTVGIKMLYSEACLNKISLGQIFVFEIDWCSVYTGWISKDCLQWDLI